MKSKRIMPLILSTVMLFSTAGCGKTVTTVESKTYDVEPAYSLSFDALGGKDVMPLGVWWGPYRWEWGSQDGNIVPDYLTDKYYKLLQECGVNMITIARNNFLAQEQRQNIYDALDYCQKYGMGSILQDSYIYNYDHLDKNVLLEHLANYINHPACIGVHCIDEPKANAFNKVKEKVDAYNSLGIEDKIISVNLYGNSNTPTNLSGDSVGISFENYIKTFLEKVDLKFLCTDIYVFYEPTEEGGSSQPDSKRFYEDLAIKRKYAQLHGIPFWCCIQVGDPGYFAGTEYVVEHLYPNESEFIWNVNASLAFGSKGLTYFTAFQPDGMCLLPGGERDFNRTGFFGMAGNINRWYYYAQKVNKQIAAIDHILMNSCNMGVIPSGKAEQEISGEVKISSFRELKSVTSTAGETLIGCFDFLGKTVLFVVNNSTTQKQDITLNFDNSYGYEIIQRAVSVDAAGASIKLTAEAGEGILVRLK